MEGTFRQVLRSEELGPATSNRLEIRSVQLSDRRVLVTRLGSGEVVAFAERCPHQDTPLDDASLWEGRLRCPRHLYLYDLRTGENVLPAREARPGTLWKLKPGYLPVHRVEERNGWVWVAEEPEPAPPGYDPADEKPPAGDPGEEPDRDDQGPAPSGPLEHPEETVSAMVGEDFELALPTSHRPGHFWRVELSEPSGPCLSVTAQGFGPEDPTCYRVRIAARAPGRVSMRWSYAQPWGQTPSEVRTFAVRIDPPSHRSTRP